MEISIWNKSLVSDRHIYWVKVCIENYQVILNILWIKVDSLFLDVFFCILSL